MNLDKVLHVNFPLISLIFRKERIERNDTNSGRGKER